MAPKDCVDVLVVGGGPVGLINALVMLKAGLNVQIVEKFDKSEQAKYGRACVIYSRSQEFFEQIGIYDDLLEIGYMMRGASTYKNGKEVPNRGWSFVDKTIEGNTFHDYTLGLQQRYTEAVLTKHIQSTPLGKNALCTPAELTGFVESDDPSDPYPVTASVAYQDKIYSVKCKFLIGADGARSSVRRIAAIPFPGTPTTQRWIRMDAVIDTDVPSARNGHAVAIESPTYGNILWLPINHGRTRIGYAMPKELSEAYDSGLAITPELVTEHAIKAVEPFKLEIKSLDWFTAYAISQRVAEQFRKSRVILSGDACHTHSSASAQGMNTGVHDSINLSWKLAGYLKGWYSEAVLDTYDGERRPTAHKLISIDREVASLIGGVIPEHLLPKQEEGKETEPADFNVILLDRLKASAEFQVGLGVSYAPNVINRPFASTILTNVLPGERAPDILLTKLDGRSNRRMYELMPNNCKFTIAMFPGDASSLNTPILTRTIQHMQEKDIFRHVAVRHLTVFQGLMQHVSETLGGISPLGASWFDRYGAGYTKYGIDTKDGAIVVVRPDTHLGSVFELRDWKGLVAYLESFLVGGESNVVAKDEKKWMEANALIEKNTYTKPAEEIEIE